MYTIHKCTAATTCHAYMRMHMRMRQLYRAIGREGAQLGGGCRVQGMGYIVQGTGSYRAIGQEGAQLGGAFHIKRRALDADKASAVRGVPITCTRACVHACMYMLHARDADEASAVRGVPVTCMRVHACACVCMRVHARIHMCACTWPPGG